MQELRDIGGEEIRYAILHLGLTIAEFADKTGYSARTVQSWLGGDREAPKSLRYVISALRANLRPFDWIDIEARMDEATDRDLSGYRHTRLVLTSMDYGMVQGCAKNDPTHYSLNQLGEIREYKGRLIYRDVAAEQSRLEGYTDKAANPETIVEF